MPSIPNVEQALIDERKLTSYLLAEEHPFGRSKARFVTAYPWKGGGSR